MDGGSSYPIQKIKIYCLKEDKNDYILAAD